MKINHNSDEEAEEFFYNNVDKSTIKIRENGSITAKYRFDSNVTLTYRKKSSKISDNVPTIDFQVKSLRKIKFIEGESN